MKLLKCLVCRGECDITNYDKAINKHIKCRQCGFSNEKDFLKKTTEVVIIRKRIPKD